jgi:hypothetical protein
MAIKHVLLPLLGNPSPGLIAAIAKCVNLAASFDAEITALAVEEDVSVRPQVMISADFPDEVKSNEIAVIEAGLEKLNRAPSARAPGERAPQVRFEDKWATSTGY